MRQIRSPEAGRSSPFRVSRAMPTVHTTNAAPSFQPGRCRKNRKPSSGAKITCKAQMNAAFDREVRVMP